MTRRIPTPADIAAAGQPIIAEQLRADYQALTNECAGQDAQANPGLAVEKLEAAHQLLQDALSERKD